MHCKRCFGDPGNKEAEAEDVVREWPNDDLALQIVAGLVVDVWSLAFACPHVG